MANPHHQRTPVLRHREPATYHREPFKEITMGNWSEQQAVKQERKEKDKTRRDKLAGYFFDLSKLSFAGLVIGITLPLFSDTQNATMWLVAMFEIVLTVLSALLANKILK